MENSIRYGNIWQMTAYKGREEFERGEVLWTVKKKNLMPDEGLNKALNIFVTPYTPISGWYIGLVNNAGFTTYAYADTAAQIGGSNGWAEWTAYSESTRQAYVGVDTPASSGTGQVHNSASQAVFTMSAAGNVRGAFMASASAKGATTGVIAGEVNFDSGTTAVVIGTILQITVIMQGFA